MGKWASHRSHAKKVWKNKQLAFLGDTLNSASNLLRTNASASVKIEILMLSRRTQSLRWAARLYTKSTTQPRDSRKMRRGFATGAAKRVRFEESKPEVTNMVPATTRSLTRITWAARGPVLKITLSKSVSSRSHTWFYR